MRLSIVVAMDNNGLIGKDNQLPWHLPADLAYFKKITTGKSILMGRKTYDSIGRPLPNRRNIVITRNTKILIPECEVVSSIDEALLLTQNEEEVMVIGGASLFFLPFSLWAAKQLKTDIQKNKRISLFLINNNDYERLDRHNRHLS